MSYRHLVMLFLILCLPPLQSALAASDPNDTEGSKDPAVFTRMPGFYIYRCDVREFDRYEFAVSPEKKEPVEGRHTFIVYYANQGVTLPSGLQVNRNYLNAAKAIGGELVYEVVDGGVLYSTIKIVQGDTEIWAEVSGGGNDQYNVQVVEKQLMRQDVVASADALATSISGTGRVVVHGVYFDTNKADLKPESEPALTEIVKMLKADTNLKLYVVGHTDNVGQFAANVKLSQDRAASVVNALVGKHGIAAARLIPYGDGPTAPMAANNNDAGRAKNRRVELVAQ
jgi:OmpA-OmpF porin, OOP family